MQRWTLGSVCMNVRMKFGLSPRSSDQSSVTPVSKRRSDQTQFLLRCPVKPELRVTWRFGRQALRSARGGGMMAQDGTPLSKVFHFQGATNLIERLKVCPFCWFLCRRPDSSLNQWSQALPESRSCRLFKQREEPPPPPSLPILCPLHCSGAERTKKVSRAEWRGFSAAVNMCLRQS